MNSLFFKGHIQLIVSVSLATIPLPMLRAEPRCPGMSPVYRFNWSTAIRSSWPYPSTIPAHTTSWWILAQRSRRLIRLWPPICI